MSVNVEISITFVAKMTTAKIPKTAKKRFLLLRYFPQNEIIKIKPQKGEIEATNAAIAAKINTVSAISELFVLIGEYQKSHLTSFFDFYGKFLLMLGAGSGKSSGRNLATFCYESLHQTNIFVVNYGIFVFAEEANSFFEDKILLITEFSATTFKFIGT